MLFLSTPAIRRGSREIDVLLNSSVYLYRHDTVCQTNCDRSAVLFTGFCPGRAQYASNVWIFRWKWKFPRSKNRFNPKVDLQIVVCLKLASFSLSCLKHFKPGWAKNVWYLICVRYKQNFRRKCFGIICVLGKTCIFRGVFLNPIKIRDISLDTMVGRD